jgi:hypothetical protein
MQSNDDSPPQGAGASKGYGDDSYTSTYNEQAVAAQLTRSSADPATFEYKRETTTDDAFGLMPILLGAFPPGIINSDTLLTKPFIRKYSPQSNIKEHAWRLRTKGALSDVFADLRFCGIPFYSLLHHERTLVEEERVHAFETETDSTKKATLKARAQTVFTRESQSVRYVKILEEINAIDTAIISAFSDNKENIVKHTTTYRKFLKNSLGKNIKAVGDAGKANIINILHKKLTDNWEDRKKEIKGLNFTPTASLREFDNWKGLTYLDAAWKGSGWDNNVKHQEELAFETAEACMKLENDFYKDLAATMATPNFVESLITDLISKKIPALGHAHTDLTADSKLGWKNFLGNFFRDILIERYEILNSHLFTLYTAVAGKCAATDLITKKATKAIIHCTMGLAMRDVTAANISDSPSLSQTKLAESIGMRVQHYKTHCSSDKLGELKAHFAGIGNTLESNVVDEASFQSSETKITFTGIGDVQVLAKGSVANIPFAGIANLIDSSLSFSFPLVTKYTHETKTAADTSVMQVKTHKARELLQGLVNSRICAHLQIAKPVPLAHIVASSVVHATEILDNAFAATLCAKTEAEATNYLLRIYHPVIKATAGAEITESDDNDAAELIVPRPAVNRSANPLLNTVQWAATPTVSELINGKNSAYIQELDKIFKRTIQIEPPAIPATPRPKSAGNNNQPKQPKKQQANRPQSAGGSVRATPKKNGDNKAHTQSAKAGGQPVNKASAKKGGGTPRNQAKTPRGGGKKGKN